MTHFSQVYVAGVPVWGGFGPFTPVGNVYFVDSGHASAADSAGTNWGKSKDEPFATIDYAVGKCTANNGDYIIVMPGHTETVTAAAGLDLDVAGITLVGVGSGENRPTINFTTATTADMDVDAANITMYNFLFTGGIDALAGPVDVNASDFKFYNCETRDVTGQTTDFIVTDANADRLHIKGWVHRGAAGDGGDSAISIVGGDDIHIEDFWIYGNFDQGAIENVTTACVRINIHHGSIWTEGAEDLAIAIASGGTGFVGPEINVMLQDNAANITEAVAGDAISFFQPIRLVNLAGESSMQTNITASTDA